MEEEKQKNRIENDIRNNNLNTQNSTKNLNNQTTEKNANNHINIQHSNVINRIPKATQNIRKSQSGLNNIGEKSIHNSRVGGIQIGENFTNTDEPRSEEEKNIDNSEENIAGQNIRSYTSMETGNSSITAKLIWKKIPLKAKLIIAGIAASLVLMTIFIIVLISPLMSLGIIKLSNNGSTGSSAYGDYTNIKEKNTYWWPVGSSETRTENGVTYADGEPVSITITSEFGGDDGFRTSNHNGLDISPGTGGIGTVNVIAAEEGEVVYPSSDSDVQYNDNGYYGNTDGGGFGNYVRILHADGTYTVYAHMAKNSITVRSGDKVKQGQVIGKIGNSGSSTGAHLHFGVMVNGSYVDPSNYISATNPRPKSKYGGSVDGDSNKQSVCLTLRANGISENGIIALMTNINHESSFDYNAYGDYENGVPTSYGLCQWHNERWNNLKTTFPNNYDTIGGQVGFLLYELENNYPTLYKGVSEGTSSSKELTYDFCYNFERPNDTKNTCTKRGESSSEFVNYVKNGCK